MFLNVRGREEQGIVAPGAEVQALKAEIMRKLKGLRDEDKKEVGIREAFDPATLYSGPYLENGPDLIIGYNAGSAGTYTLNGGTLNVPGHRFPAILFVGNAGQGTLNVTGGTLTTGGGAISSTGAATGAGAASSSRRTSTRFLRTSTCTVRYLPVASVLTCSS